MKDCFWIAIQPTQCRQGLAEFRALLDSKSSLEENADIKPFFESHPHLSALLGLYNYAVTRCDMLAFQYQLFGDFSVDMVVGDSGSKAYSFIEWEDATPGSLFRQQGKKATPEWATRFEHAFSQIVDWFHKLDDMAKTDDLESRFGARHVQYIALLVAGRDEQLAHARERNRWEWRSRKILVNSVTVQSVTYDQLYAFLADRIDFYFPTTNRTVASHDQPDASPQQ